jgi:hypothetical protein
MKNLPFKNSKIKAESAEYKDQDMRPYENVMRYLVEVDKTVTLEEISEFCRKNSWNWHRLECGEFGTYGGGEVYKMYFTLAVGIGD